MSNSIHRTVAECVVHVSDLGYPKARLKLPLKIFVYDSYDTSTEGLAFLNLSYFFFTLRVSGKYNMSVFLKNNDFPVP